MGNAAEKPGTGGLIPDVLIIGAGAMAVLFAARLSAAGLRVGVLDEWAEGVRALNETGACLETSDQVSCHPVQAGSHAAGFTGARFAIVLVKAWQTAPAAGQLAACLHPDGVALTLQNGLGNRELLEQALGPQRVLAGVTTLGASLSAPGRATEGGQGEVALEDGPRGAELAALLRQAGLNVRLEAGWKALLWDKLVVNAAVNPVSALLELRNGDILTNPAAGEVVFAAARETARVAGALDIRLAYSDPQERVMDVLTRTAANRSSMLQDVLRGAPTEIDAITGAVIHAGEQAGVDTPVNRTLYRLVQAKVAARRQGLGSLP